MYSKSMLLKILCFLIILLLTFGTASATVFLSENWDTGTPASDWPCKNIPTSCASSTLNGWSGRTWDCTRLGGAASGLSTTIYHSPPRSFYMEREPGVPFPCNIYKDFAVQGSGYKKVHLRFYVYFQTAGVAGLNQWTHDNLIAGDDQNHWVHLGSAQGANKIYIDLLDIGSWRGWPPECWESGVNKGTFFVQTGSGVNFNSNYCAFNIYNYADKWVCIEFMFDLTNSKYALWIDGIQRIGTGGQGMDQAYTGVTDFFRLLLDSFRSGGAEREAHGSSYYIDDIVIADQYIGPMGTPPASPTNLRIVN